MGVLKKYYCDVYVMNLLFQLCRVRTLPLSLSVVLCANSLAWWYGKMRFSVLLLMLLTVLLLQIVSNIANDYGDGQRGTDTFRSPDAPYRVCGANVHMAQRVRLYLFGAIILCIVSGLALLAVSLRDGTQIGVFMLLGATALVMALAYTLGRFAYGYFALGEVAVFLCFGLLGVIGGFYLQTNQLNNSVWLPAAGCGFLAAAVLHVNNIRDRISDRLAGKRTLANSLSCSGSKLLYGVWLLVGCACYMVFAWAVAWQSALWLAMLPMLWRHGYRVYLAHNETEMGHELGSVVVIHFGMNSLFALGLWWGR